MYRVIMVPVDGSAFSREAVFQGLRLARNNGAQLRLVRVASIPGLVGGPEVVSLENAARSSERDAMLAQLYRLAAECRGNTVVDVTATVEDGPVADALRGHALRHEVDLIVMGSHARRGLARVWLGSVADRLIRETGLPVLLVRPPSLATELTDGSCYKRIIVPLDGAPLAEGSLGPALALAMLEHAELTLVRVVPVARNMSPEEQHSTIGPARARDVEEAESYLAGVRMRLAVRVRLADHHVRVRSAVVVADDVPAAIMGFAQANDGDLIAIATHGRGGIARAIIGSVADRVMSEGVLSALVIHPAEEAKPAYEQESRSAGEVVFA
jgi:nucleotide-binding universal stress UspA family protein